MKRLVIFDLDGTLLDTIADLAESTNYALAQLGFPGHEVQAYKQFVGNGVYKLFERALPEQFRNQEYILKMKELFFPHYNENGMRLTAPYPGIYNLLTSLAEKGIKIAIASNKYQHAVDVMVNNYFSEFEFTAVYGQREGVNVKPKKARIAEKIRLQDSIRYQDSIKLELKKDSGYVNAFKVDTILPKLNIYQLINGKTGYTVIRPQKENQKYLLAIAASFTAKDLKTVIGNHIVDGVKIQGTGNPSGYCAIIGKKMVIKSSKDSLQYYTNKAISKKGDLFRQILLIRNGKAVPCDPFRGRALILRAITLYQNKPTVIETEGNATIEDFVNAMLKIGVTNAIYCDMGSWSYAWYRNIDGIAKDFGTNFMNTDHQTNWFVFEKL